MTVRPFALYTIKISNNTPVIVTNKTEELLERCKNFTMPPLLRLRIDIDGDVDLNKHNIQVRLESKIANPNEALRISRKVHNEVIRTNSFMHKNDFEGMCKRILDGCGLKAPTQGRVVDALLNFPDKDDRESFTYLLKDGLKSIIDCINSDDLMADSIDGAIKNARERLSFLDRHRFD